MAYLEIRPEELLPPSGAGKRALKVHYREVRQRVNPTPPASSKKPPLDAKTLANLPKIVIRPIAAKPATVDKPVKRYDPRWDHRGYPTIHWIVNTVAKKYDVSATEIVGRSKRAAIIRPRMIAVFLSRVLRPDSFPAIGRGMGGRDHTTAMYSFGRIEQEAIYSPLLRYEIEGLKAKLYPRPGSEAKRLSSKIIWKRPAKTSEAKL